MKEPKNKETYEYVVQTLIVQGWKRGNQCRLLYDKEYWYRRYAGVPRCACNDDKEGMQVVISVSEHDGRVSYEIGVTGQKADGAWVKLLAYAWEGGLLEVMDSQISQLLAGWTVFAKGNPI